MDLTVSKLAAQVGLTPDTVRYYEKAGLLPAPARTPSGYRVYGEDAVERLRFVKGAQRIGLRLREITELLEIGDRGLCPCGHAETLLDRRMAEIDTEIASLRRTKQDLLAFRTRFAAIDCPPSIQPWPCAEQFASAVDGDQRR